MLSIYLEQLQNELDNFNIGPSNIHGNGVMCKTPISNGSFINNAILPTGHAMNIKTTKFGAHMNHSVNPNAETRKEGDIYKTYAIIDIKPGDEITVDYTKNKELEQPKPGWIK